MGISGMVSPDQNGGYAGYSIYILFQKGSPGVLFVPGRFMGNASGGIHNVLGGRTLYE
jgi:hypothetical protein